MLIMSTATQNPLMEMIGSDYRRSICYKSYLLWFLKGPWSWESFSLKRIQEMSEQIYILTANSCSENTVTV